MQLHDYSAAHLPCAVFTSWKVDAPQAGQKGMIVMVVGHLLAVRRFQRQNFEIFLLDFFLSGFRPPLAESTGQSQPRIFFIITI